MAEIATSHSAGAVRRNVYVFGAVSFFNDTASEMAYWILPAFLASLGAGPAALGLIEGVAESVASVGKLFSGYLTDAVERRKPIVVFGYLLANLVKPLLALSTRWWQVLFIRFADRTAKGLRATPRDVMLAESVEKEKIGRTYGLLQAMDSAGAIAGPLIAWLVIARTGNLRWVFWLAAIPGAIAIVVVLLARETRSRGISHEPAASLFAPVHLSGRFFYVLGAVLIFSIGNSSDMFLVLRAQQIGITPRMAPLLGLVFNLTYTLGSWPAGWLSDRRSRNAIAAAGYLVFSITYFTFALAPSHAAIWTVMAGYGLYYALTSPVLRALVVETVEPGSRGRAFGLFYFSTSIAALLSSVVTGQLWNRYGAALPFYASAALAVVAALLLLAAGNKPAPAGAILEKKLAGGEHADWDSYH
ncbi:MAG TPA: MFS transporter [Candidatus Angelobacter sp.]|nr:MFS transporter [Candidatus Angelobacter sp.]